MPVCHPLALYIHWPFCRSKCPYCDFNSHVREGVDEKAWQRSLLSELAYAAEKTPGRRLESIFFGGGTPSLMPPATVAALIEAAEKHWGFEQDIEITLEANPTSAEAASFAGFRAAGVNRVSLGVQALNAADLKFLGRQHSANEAMRAVALAAKTFPRYSFDLIYARPEQTALAWEQELKEALDHANGHLSLYQLTIEENTAFHHAHAKGAFTVPKDEKAAGLYELTQAVMEEAGMPAYEISNHAKPGEESRHNLAYWRGHEYAGVGPGAHGRIRNTEMQKHRNADSASLQFCNSAFWMATATIKSPERWLEAVSRQGHGYETWQELSETEEHEEKLMMRLRLAEGFAREEMPFIAGKNISKLQRDGLLEEDEEMIRTTPRGRLLLNYLTAELLA